MSKMWSIVLVVSLLLAAVTIHAQDGGLRETFDNPDLPGWERSPEVTVAEGVLHVPGPGGYAFWPGAWSDMVLTLRARLDGSGDLVVGYSVTDGGQYELVLNQGGASLRRDAGGMVQELMGIPGGIAVGEWQQIEIHVSGTEHFVAVNGQPSLFGHDPEPLPPGGVLLHVEGTAAGEFDDLTVTASEAGAPSSAESPPVPQTAAQPAYAAGTWVKTGGPPGGIGYDIRMRSDNPDIMYVTEVSSGVNMSTDGGLTWFPTNQGILSDPIGSYNIFCLTIDPHDDDTVWAGTQITGHIYRSSDGGQTWEQRDQGIPHQDISVRGITIDPYDQDVVYAGVEVGPAAWGGPGTKGRVYKSVDAGLTWNMIWEGDNLARYVLIDPRDANRLYVSTGIFDRQAANADLANGIFNGVGLVRSIDGGQTWTVPAELAGAYIPSIFMHPKNPDILLAAVTDPPGVGGVYVTRDGGDTWERILDSPQGADAVEIALSNPDIWYAGAEDTIWRSDDAGQTWQEFPMRTADRNAGFPIDLQVDPRDPYRIFVNNYSGGNMLSSDGGQTWIDASHGYTGAHIGGLAVSPTDPALVFASSYSSRDGGQTWTGLLLNRLESIVFYSPGTSDNAVYVMAGDNGGRVWHSRDGGQTWNAAQVVDLRAEARAGNLDSDNHALQALAVAPSDPQIVYAGFVFYEGIRGHWSFAMARSAGFHRSIDGGYTWEHITGIPFEQTGILRIAVHPTDSQVVYAATVSGLYLSQDGGDTWQHLDDLDAAVFPFVNDPEYYPTVEPMVYDVLIDPFDSQTLYVATIQAGVFRSADGGVTWAQAAAGMDPNEPLYDLVADPNRQGVLYASSWLSGVFVSTDAGQSWRSLVNGLDMKGMRQLALSSDGTVLYAGTISRGVYRLGQLDGKQ
jgi:photosystem II stability/assembly factor-like uncharacterized protein